MLRLKKDYINITWIVILLEYKRNTRLNNGFMGNCVDWSQLIRVIVVIMG